MKFNASQQKALTHNTGPMIVLAGPGSGKTAVITSRTKYLIEEYGVDPRNILVITFTKAAASEMKQRFQHLIYPASAPVSFGTFHSIFFTILKYAYNYSSANIVTEEQRLNFFREIIESLNLEIEDEKDFISGISGEISLVKGEMISLDHYYSINCSEDVFKNIFNQYEGKLRRAGLIDFDDMLVFCYELLKDRSDILELWQQKFRYILIDEFQDINRVQYEIIRLLAKPENNLFIVGDDDQSIYRFRGAKPEIMLNFDKDYPDTKYVLLNVNYRSTRKIISGASRVVKNNQKRFQKDISTVNPEGDEIIYRSYKTLTEENTQVIQDILTYNQKGIPFQEIAVLFRTNTQPRALLDKLMEYNIPFSMKDALPNIYDHWIARNVIAYIQIALGSRERAQFIQIANRPKRYLSRDCFKDPTVNLEELKAMYSDKEWMLDRILKLEYDLKLLGKMNPYSAINYIRKGIGYEEYLTEYANFRRIKVDELIDVLDELQEAAKNYPSFDAWFQHIEDYSKELQIQQKERNIPNSNRVSLSTMHSSKGLEYKVVIIIDANEGITPHSKAITDADMEEERRMFYVAMTRAKQYLHIYSVKERYNKELEISRFVGELLVDCESLAPNTRIEHKTYGEGTIVKNEDGKLIIYFDKLKKERVLDLKFCIGNHLIKVINS
jgi:DNA helicase-2/ATP-dependent DNA helicase PcrA